MSRSLAETIRKFYEVHRQELYTYALSLTRCRDAAEDAIQTAVCKVLHRGRIPREIRPYIFRCVRNAAIDDARLRQRGNGHYIFDTSPETNPAETLELRQHVEHLLKELNEDERECIVLRIYSDMTFKEIAEIRGVSLNTAASWYRRGLQKMQKSLEEIEL